MQAPCEENGLVDGVIMWQATGVEGGHDDRAPAWDEDSRRASLRRLAIGAQVTNLPHKLPLVRNKSRRILVKQVMKTLICLLLLTGLTLSAGELAGKWSGKFDITTADGEPKPDSAVMNLKVDGTKVTGTAGPNEDQQWTIRNGKLEAGKLTFDVVLEGNGDDKGTLVFDLVFDGETIRGSAVGTSPGGEKMSAKVDLKRVS